jgi:hypothetical protein
MQYSGEPRLSWRVTARCLEELSFAGYHHQYVEMPLPRFGISSTKRGQECDGAIQSQLIPSCALILCPPGTLDTGLLDNEARCRARRREQALENLCRR